MWQYVFNKYSYTESDTTCKIEKGDIVLDCGGYNGDSALLFASLCGSTGHVYSFEFISWLQDDFKKNLSVNPILSKNITIVPLALYNESDQTINYYYGDGAGTLGVSESLENHTVQTISIDDFVTRNHLEKVDFIKMDIEGAELDALKGGIQTMKKYKPKLAISIYHKPEDVYDIPKFLKDLDVGYKFYFDQYSIYNSLKTLYAK